jgi:hypothetical protein
MAYDGRRLHYLRQVAREGPLGALREMIDSLPFNDEQICDECLRSFWRRIVERPEPNGQSKH